MVKAPKFLRQYFWDIDFIKLDPEKNPQYVIERLLEFGDVRSVRWVLKTFPKEVIAKTVMTRRGLSPRTASFWAFMLNIDDKDIVCLQEQYLTMRQTHWPY